MIALIGPGWMSQRPIMLFAFAGCSGLATFATWKRVVSGAIINAVLGLALTVWSYVHDGPAVAFVLFIPVVCGPVTAARGAYVLNNLARH